MLAGHGLNYTNVQAIAAIPEIVELNIGHSIVARAAIVGMDRAVRDMVSLLGESPSRRPTIRERVLRTLAAAALLALLMAAHAVAGTQRVTIRTDDGVSLAATWYEPGTRSAPAVILVHMLHKTRR